MKKLLALILSLLMLLSLSACGSSDTKPEAEPAQDGSAASTAPQASDVVEITIDSWRTDDIAAWEDVIIPAFEASHEGIKVKFNAINNAEYTTVLTTRIQGGAAGDIIMCEPYDSRISLYTDGYLANLNEIDGLETEGIYEDFALSAWSTDDGDLYGLPLAAVSHGFLYNKTVFDQLGLEIPDTVDEFFQLCEKIKEAGYTPIALGAAEEWIPNVYAYSIVCPTFTKGEEGRQGLINGTASFTDQGFVEAFQFIEDWIPYLPEGYAALGSSDMYTMFATQQCLMMPAGSWDISVMDNMIQGSFEFGAFPVPDAGYGKYVCFHPDNALSLNTASANMDAAIEFLKWTTTEEFAQLMANALSGFYPMSTYPVTIDNAVANEMLSWASTLDGASPRIAYQYISRDFNTDNEIARVTTLMLLGEMDAQTAAETLQNNFSAG